MVFDRLPAHLSSPQADALATAQVLRELDNRDEKVIPSYGMNTT